MQWPPTWIRHGDGLGGFQTLNFAVISTDWQNAHNIQRPDKYDILTEQYRFELQVSGDGYVNPVDGYHVHKEERYDVAPHDLILTVTEVFRRSFDRGRATGRGGGGRLGCYAGVLFAVFIVFHLDARPYLRERRRCGHRVDLTGRIRIQYTVRLRKQKNKKTLINKSSNTFPQFRVPVRLIILK